METPNVIYLIDCGDEISWCDDPNPSGYIEPEDVVKYIKSSVNDAAPQLLEALERLINDAEFFSARLGNSDEIESISKAKSAIKAAKGE